ncbi:MAG: PDZ domain-containing protein [Saprospiraceae bacterium]
MKKIITTTFLFCMSIVFIFAQHQNNRAYIGIHTNSISEKKAKKLGFENSNGSYITNVIGNSAADKNGLKPFDYIYKIGDEEFSEDQHLTSVMRNYQAGDEAMVYFIRKGEKMAKKMTFGKRSDGNSNHRTREEDPFLGIEQNHTRIPEEVVGVSVNIEKNSTAEKIGMEDDDIILAINDFKMVDWHDVGSAIDMMDVGEEIKVKYLRDNKVTVTNGPIQSLAASKSGYNHGSYNYSYSYNNGHQNSNNNQKESQEEVVEVEEIEMEDMEVMMEDLQVAEAEQIKEEVGVEMPVVQNLSIERLNVFPNPSQGEFNLKFFLPNNAPTSIRIFNSSGQLIYSNDLGNFEGDFMERFDLTDSPAGTYYLMIQQNDLSITKKVVIVRT